MKDLQHIREKLKEHGLKVTPQRVAVLEAVFNLDNHPTADDIVKLIKKKHANLAIGTVYKALDVFALKGLVNRVKTDTGCMRYDAVTEKHHHLYTEQNTEIGDYYDPELDKLLEQYFTNKKIPGFNITDIRLQIVGEYKTESKNH